MLPEKLTVSLAAAVYVAVFLTAMPSGAGKVRGALVGAGLFLAPLLLAAGIAIRWERLGQGPFMTLFEILFSNLFSLGLIYAALYWRVPGTRRGLSVVMLLLLVLAVWALLAPGAPVVLPPTFDHPWLWVHVLTGKLFLGAFMTAAALSIYGVIHGKAGFIDGDDALVWNLCAAAFVFHGAMLIAGAVWAHDAWGRYWSWDPLEVWSLITWVALGALLHARVTYDLPARLGWLLVVLVFALAFLTFFGIPFVSQAPHKGVM